MEAVPAGDLMLYMIIERTPASSVAAVGERFREKGRMLPDEVRYEASWLNEDGSVNSRENPAKAGSIVAIWATGLDQLRFFPKPADGEITTGDVSSYPYAEVFVNGQPDYDVLYAGPAPGMVAGVTQINFRLPSPLQSQSAIIIGIRRANSLGLTSQGASLWVRP